MAACHGAAVVPTPTLPPNPTAFYSIEPCSAPAHAHPVKSGVVIAALMLAHLVIFRPIAESQVFHSNQSNQIGVTSVPAIFSGDDGTAGVDMSHAIWDADIIDFPAQALLRELRTFNFDQRAMAGGTCFDGINAF